jgi:hypothetical protein
LLSILGLYFNKYTLNKSNCKLILTISLYYSYLFYYSFIRFFYFCPTFLWKFYIYLFIFFVYSFYSFSIKSKYPLGFFNFLLWLLYKSSNLNTILENTSLNNKSFLFYCFNSIFSYLFILWYNYWSYSFNFCKLLL